MPNVSGDIDGEKIARFDEAIDCGEVDVVRINVILAGPFELADRVRGSGTDAGGFRADGGVFPVGFIPNGDDEDALACGEDARLKLRRSLMGEAITHSEGIFSEFKHLKPRMAREANIREL